MNVNDNGYFGKTQCVAEVIVRGTDAARMRERGLEIINFNLRILRVGLRQHPAIHDQQLRFRAGKGWAIEDGRIGWSDHVDNGYSIGINDNLLGIVKQQPIYHLEYNSIGKINKKVNLAMQWVELSRLSTDPLLSLLYDMFALETILGDKKEKLKARGIAFRRALLSTIVNGNYPDPENIHRLYEQVRSYAVHGEEIPLINKDEAKSLSWSTRLAINEYLIIVNDHKFTKPQQVRDYLLKHEEHDKLLHWLIKINPNWNDYQVAK